MTSSSGKPSLLRFTAPLALLLALSVGSLLPFNVYFWDVLNVVLPAKSSGTVVVVGIDDDTLGDYGRITNWNRSLYARAIDTLHIAGAKVIALDLLLDTPAPGDEALASALNNTPNVVLATTTQEPSATRWNTLSGVSGLNLLSSVSGSKTSYFQTAYPDVDGTLWPAISTRIAKQLSVPVALNTTPHLLRYPRTPLPVVSFKDLLSGNIRYSDLQNKAVIIGVTASGLPGTTLLDSALHEVPGVVLQARAVESLLQAPYLPLTHWLRLLLCAAVALLTVTLRGYWGFVLAAVTLLLGIAAFTAHLLFPSITLSMVAVLSSSLVLVEHGILARRTQRLDPMTGLGNRLALTSAIETRWDARGSKPLGLLLITIDDFHQFNEHYGPVAGNTVLRQLANTLKTGRGRHNLVFRWGADEFVLLLEGATLSDLQQQEAQVQQELASLNYCNVPVQVSIGKALSAGLTYPSELIERASRDLYRLHHEQGRERVET